jgi:hypothetical protein
LTISSPAIGGTVTDGTVVWTVSRDLSLIGGGALTGTNLTWNANDLAGSAIVAKSLGTNGYIKYASGLIVQWGIQTISDPGPESTYRVNYNINFSNVSVPIITNDATGSSPSYASIYTMYNNGFFVQSSNPMQINWIAIGY